MIRKNIPFDFVLDYLLPLEVTIRPMFGLFSIYAGKKIMLLLRERKDHTDTNGIWIATSREHHKSLKKDFPSLCSISTYSNDATSTEWQLLPADEDDFEASAIKLCEFIVHRDFRIGRTPEPRQNKKTKKSPSKSSR